MGSILKPWRCPSGHTLGMVNRNGSGVRRLLLYRQAVDQEGQLYRAAPTGAAPTAGTSTEGPTEEAPGEVDVIAIVEGYVADVRCSVCGRIRTWVPGEEAMRHLLSQAKRFKEELEIRS
jgi:hypothetical protein